MQEEASAWRPAAVLAAVAKAAVFAADAPPREIRTFKLGMELLELLDGSEVFHTSAQHKELH